MGNTDNQAIPLPTPTENVADDVDVLIAAFERVDQLITALSSALDGKAASGHEHAIAAITGLVDALAEKATSDHNHDLGSLSDVDVSGIAVGYLMKWSGTGFVPTSAAAALGVHGHTMSQITDLVTTLAGKLAAASNLSDIASATTARANLKMVTIAQAAYDVLDPPDADTIYFVTE